MKRVTINMAVKRYSRVVIAGGIGAEKKAPVRSTEMIRKKRIALMIARPEANLTLPLLKRRRTIDARSNARPTKIVVIATYPSVFKADIGRVSKPIGVKRMIITTFTIITMTNIMAFLESFVPVLLEMSEIMI
jgi:hypothetical protein